MLFVVPAALLALPAAVPVIAAPGTGYHVDYDYPGQGDDWYGRSRSPVVDPRIDFYRATAVSSLEGDDFGFGYEAVHDLLGWGPPLQRTQTKHTEYVFRFAVLVPCQGGDALGCDDWVFCNGAEVCVTGVCSAGVPLSCNDGDVCTLDSCGGAADTCFNLPGPGPGEVAGLLLDRVAAGSTVARLTWSPDPLATSYNVYRGRTVTLEDLVCFLPGVEGTTTVDDGDFAALLNYLVSSKGCGVESGMGTTSAGEQRLNPAPCP